MNLFSYSPETRFQQYCSREYTDEEIAAAPKAILMRCSSADEQPAATGTSQNNVSNNYLLSDTHSEDFINSVVPLLTFFLNFY